MTQNTSNTLTVSLAKIYKGIQRINSVLFGIPLILVLSTFSTFLFYNLFFHFSSFIWSQNVKVDPNTLTPEIRYWIVTPGERDGIETFVLYALVLFSILLTVIFVFIKHRFSTRKPTIQLILIPISVINIYFFYQIGFRPPMASPSSWLVTSLVSAIVLCPLSVVLLVSRRSEILANILVVVFLIPVCFIATEAISQFDYSYVFAPALRLLNHYPVKDIYFQYDILLSGLAYFWMRLNGDLNLFQIVGQFSFYFLFVASFIVARRVFLDKKLAYFLLTALVLVKIYGAIVDPNKMFQVTPMRLDLWIVLLILSYLNGIYSRVLGLCMGLFVVFHRTFGLIYAASYFEVVAILFVLDLLINTPSIHSFINIFKRHFLLILPNILMLSLAITAVFVLFGDIRLEAASTYQQLGIGFMPISSTSFFWYFPILASLLFITLINRRRNLSETYFNFGLLLIFLCVGNLIYFFGRSHENNLINISASVIFMLFFALDLIFGSSLQKYKKNAMKIMSYVLPFCVVLIIVMMYSGQILERVYLQAANLVKRQVIQPMSMNLHLDTVKELTHNSKNVFFVSKEDFYYYYFGGYKYIGNYAPFTAWVNQLSLIGFIQNLLDRGYYIVFAITYLDYPSGIQAQLTTRQELISALNFNQLIERDGFVVISSTKSSTQ